MKRLLLTLSLVFFLRAGANSAYADDYFQKTTPWRPLQECL